MSIGVQPRGGGVGGGTGGGGVVDELEQMRFPKIEPMKPSPPPEQIVLPDNPMFFCG